jgi:uncharacterized protein YraI
MAHWHFVLPLALALTAASLAPAVAAPSTVRASARVAVQAGPGFSYARIGTLEKNQHVTLSYCTRSGNWCQLGGEMVPAPLAGGWVRAGYLVGMAAKSFVTPFTFSVGPRSLGF